MSCFVDEPFGVAVGPVFAALRAKAFDTAFTNADNLGFPGGIPKRSTGTDCKSVGSAFEGSNPSPSTRLML